MLNDKVNRIEELEKTAVEEKKDTYAYNFTKTQTWECDKEIALQTVIRLRDEIGKNEQDLKNLKRSNSNLSSERHGLLEAIEKMNNDKNNMIVYFTKAGKAKHSIGKLLEDLSMSKEELKIKLGECKDQTILNKAYIDGFELKLMN